MEVIDKYFIFKVDKETTLMDLINEKLSLAQNYKNKPGELLSIIFKGTSNAANVYSLYTAQEQADNAVKLAQSTSINNGMSAYSTCLSIIHPGTYLHIPQNEIPVDVISIIGKGLFLKENNLAPFLTEAYKNIQNDPDNVPAAIPLVGEINYQLKNYHISAWIYSKAFNKIIDVTKYCYNLHTSSNMDSGGSFTISLEGINDIADTIDYGEDIVNMYKLEPDSQGQIKMSYWAKYFQRKDIVWIRFEKLELEKTRKPILNGFEVPKDDIKGAIFDMIGLVENVNENTDYQITERTVTVSGKDLTLLLSEDGSYFYPLLFAMGSDAIMTGDTDNDSKWFKRNVFKEGIYESFFTLGERSIKDSIGFVINQLSNLGIVDSSLFSAFQDEKTNTGGDTSGEKRKKVLSIVNSGNSSYLDWVNVEGIWQIIDVFVDSALDNRRQVDAMLEKSEGNLLSQMQSFCQHPFVEFTGDTFGDKYIFFAREPIWTKDAVQNFIKEQVLIEIDAKDVYNQNLDWETQFYTSYEIKPNASFLAYSKYVSLSYTPLVFFSQIAEDFGNHPFSVSDSYIDERALSGEGADPNIDKFREAVIRDLRYCIEINSYLPFTRKGTLVINGDRRIKKGTWIYFLPTNEIYYVSSVDQSFSCSSKTVDRTTTLTVERGMVWDYALGVDSQTESGETVNISYFNIVDLQLMETLLVNSIAKDGVVNPNPQKMQKAKFDVNLDVYNFFKLRNQLEISGNIHQNA